jgi:hypothetical protein
LRRVATTATATRGWLVVWWRRRTDLVGWGLGSYDTKARWQWQRDASTVCGSGCGSERGSRHDNTVVDVRRRQRTKWSMTVEDHDVMTLGHLLRERDDGREKGKRRSCHMIS